MLLIYSYIFTFLDSVKAILVHRAHRLLSESTRILCRLRSRPGGRRTRGDFAGIGEYPRADRCVGAGENEAKSLLRKLLGSNAATSVLGPGAHSLAAKYFAGQSRERASKIRWLLRSLGCARQETVNLSEYTPRAHPPIR